MKAAVLILALALTSCATCNEHPIICGVAAASLAITLETSFDHHHTVQPHDVTIGTPSCANGSCK